jgi:hypothetical protein
MGVKDIRSPTKFVLPPMHSLHDSFARTSISPSPQRFSESSSLSASPDGNSLSPSRESRRTETGRRPDLATTITDRLSIPPDAWAKGSSTSPSTSSPTSPILSRIGQIQGYSVVSDIMDYITTNKTQERLLALRSYLESHDRKRTGYVMCTRALRRLPYYACEIFFVT